MNAKLWLIVGLVCAVVAGTALGADVRRDVTGGDWSSATEWDTDALPGPSDRAIHPIARGTLALDTDLGSGDRVIDAFLGNGGGSPRSELTFETLMDLTVNVNYTTTRALGLNYRTFLLDQNELTVSGTIVGGDWFIDGASTVEAGAVDLANANWTIDEGIVSVSDDMADDSGQVTINDDGELHVGTDGSGNLLANAITINTGGLVDVDDNVDVDTSFNVNGGTLTAATAGTGAEGVGQFQIEHDGTVTISGEVRVPGGSRLEYGDITSTGNTLSAGSLNFSAATSFVSTLSGASSPSLDLTVSGDVEVVTTSVTLKNNWDATGIDLTLDGSSAQDMEAISTNFDSSTPSGV
jgi:hypothetical protein